MQTILDIESDAHVEVLANRSFVVHAGCFAPLPFVGRFSNPRTRTQSGYGTRAIPNGTVTGLHFVQTPDYVQITGTGLPLPGGVVSNLFYL
jgi:hypothetical protein